MRELKTFLRNQKGYTILQGLVVLMIVFIGFIFVVEVGSAVYSYNYIKTQMDMSNRAVYKLIDLNRLADREIYINEINGTTVFTEKLKENLRLNPDYTPKEDCPIRIIGQVEIESFKIYNQDDLPAITPVGTHLNYVAIHSRIKVRYSPIFFSFIPVTFNPYMDTDAPDVLLKTFHP